MTELATISDITSWYNAAEGTVYAEGSRPVFGSTQFPWIWAIEDAATQQHRMGLFHDDPASDKVFPVSRVNSVSVVGISAAAAVITPGVVFKAALAYKLDDYGFAMTGGAPGTDTSAGVPTVDRMRIGSGDSVWNGHVRRIRVYRSRLTNAKLQEITA